MSKYSNDAKLAVAGLLELAEWFPMYTPVIDVIVSQWIFETDHFRSKLFAGFYDEKTDKFVVPYNCGGKKGGKKREQELFDMGLDIPLSSIEYCDWNKKTDQYLKITDPKYCAILYHFFLKRPPYKVAMAYLQNYEQKDFSPEKWLLLLAVPYVADISGIMRENYISQDEYALAVDKEYVKRILAISKRKETKELIQNCKVPTVDDYPTWLLGEKD